MLFIFTYTGTIKVILPAVYYGCEIWSLALREGQRLRVHENKVHRKIFGIKRDEIKGDWRTLMLSYMHSIFT